MAQDSKKTGGISGWFSALMGKPKTKAPDVPVVETAPVPTEVKPAEKPIIPPEPLTITDLSKEDSVKEDMVKFKAFIGKYKKEAEKKVAPVAQNALNKVSETAGAVDDKKFYKKLINIFFAIFFVLILIYVGATLYNIWSSKKPVAQISDGPTPTPIPFEPSKPSVYSEDEEILKIEENVSVLKNELTRVTLRENDLQPPRLDFDVTFK